LWLCCIAEGQLEILEISFSGIHGQMLNKALGEVIKFYEERMR
jgi:hypothetical protein